MKGSTEEKGEGEETEGKRGNRRKRERGRERREGKGDIDRRWVREVNSMDVYYMYWFFHLDAT